MCALDTICPREKDHPRCTDSMSSTQDAPYADHGPAPAIRAQRDAVCPARTRRRGHDIAFASRVRRDHGAETSAMCALRFPVAWIGMRRLLLAPAGHEAADSEYSRYPATLLPVVIAIAASLQAASAPASIARRRGPIKVVGKYVVSTEVYGGVHVGWCTGWVAPSCGVASAHRVLCSGCAVPRRGGGPESAGG